MPALIYLSFKLGNLLWMWIALVFLLGAGIFAALRAKAVPRRSDIEISLTVVVFSWLLLSMSLTLDITVGNRLYPSSAILDTNVRSQMVASLAQARSLPPDSYFSRPYGAVPLRYHYLYFLLAGTVERIAPGFIAARMALAALTFWTGLALLVVVSQAIGFMHQEFRPRQEIVAFGLLLVGGLDVFPVSIEMLSRWWLNQSPITPLPDIEWWNGRAQVFSWLDTAIWHPHHIAATIGCVLAGLTLYELRTQVGLRRILSIAAASIFLASAAGTSVLISAVFIVFLVIVAVECLLHSPKLALLLLTAGGLALLLAFPFLKEASTPLNSHSGFSFAIAVRPFQPVNVLFDELSITSPRAWNIGYLLSLPFNYLIEFGVFFATFLWWVIQGRRLLIMGPFKEHLLLGLLIVSIVLVSFVQSGTAAANDFGYRGILPAQFVLLLLASEFFSFYRDLGHPHIRMRGLVVCLVWLGLSSTVLGVFMLRHAIGFGNPGVDLHHVTLRLPKSAERLYDLRQAYLWIRSNTRSDAIVQEDPLSWQSLSAQFGERRTVVYTWFNGDQIMSNPHSGSKTFNSALLLFEPGTSPSLMMRLCQELHIDYVVVQDSDPIWFDRESYLWKEIPRFASPRVRVIGCNVSFGNSGSGH
jgi:hypothetical protein